MLEGARATDNERLRRVTERLARAAKPKYMILFGSQARGEASEDSDVDVMVVKSEVATRGEEMVRPGRLLRSFEILGTRSGVNMVPLLLVILMCFSASAESSWKAVGATHQDAQTSTVASVLDSGRAALGGAALRAVRGVEIEIRKSRQSGVGSSATYYIAMPDRFLRISNIDVIPGRVHRGFSGDRLITRREGGPDVTLTPELSKKMLSSLRADAARLLVALLLTSDTPIPVRYSYVGRAEAPDGIADALDVTGPDGFAVRLYLDVVSHHPVMLSYAIPAPGRVVQQQDGQRQTTRVERDLNSPDTVEERWHFAEYALSAGVHFPRVVTITSDGRDQERWDLSRIVVNPNFPTNRFSYR